MQALIFLILLVFLSIFWLQNPQSIALVFFGSPIPLQLSLGTWILIFALLGLITSFLIQILARGSSFLQSKPKKQRPQPPFKEVEEKPFPRSYRETEWDAKTEDDEWEIEKPPRTPSISNPEPIPQPVKTEPRQPSVYSYNPPPQQKEERIQQPKTVPTEPKDSDVYPKTVRKEPKDGDVYDANYRVINPPNYENPLKNTDSPNTDEEDWI